METLFFLCNPGGGSADQQEQEEFLLELQRIYAVDVQPIDDPEPIAERVARALDHGTKLFLAAGGDGTVSTLAGCLRQTEGVMAIWPRGTANSIAASLGLPSAWNEVSALLQNGVVRSVDMANVQDKPMVLMATAGLHADAITTASSESKSTFGILAYIARGFSLALDSKLFAFRACVDDRIQVEGEVSSIVIANMAPKSTVLAQGTDEVDPFDGLLDVTIVSFTGVLDAALTSVHLLSTAQEGEAASRENITQFRCRSISVELASDRSVMVDGEDAFHGSFKAEIVPQGLQVLFPAASNLAAM